MTDTLRRGAAVLIDTDLAISGRALRGRRGTVHRRGVAGSVFVCTCNGGALHAHNCPFDLPLRRDEVINASRHERGTATTAAVLLALIFGGLVWLAALHAGQRVLCDIHDGALRYCETYEAGHNDS